MRNPWRLWLVVGALALGAFAVACGDDNNSSSDGGDATATDEATTEATSDDGSSADATDTPEDGSNATDDSGSSGSADVPLPDGANEESSFTSSGSQLPFAVPSESGVDASTFGEVTVKSYTVDGTPEDIVNFYKDNQGDWDEAYA